MSEEDKKALENAGNGANQSEVEKKDSVASQGQDSSADADFDVAVELERLRVEKENYRKAALKAKGKLPEDEEVDLSNSSKLDEVIRQRVQEELARSKETELEEREKKLLDKVIRENKELKVAAQNRAQLGGGGTGQGTGSQSNLPQPKNHDFTDEQTAYFKSRGIDPENVKKTMQKLANRAPVVGSV